MFKKQSLLTQIFHSEPEKRRWYFGFKNASSMPTFMKFFVWNHHPVYHHCFAFCDLGEGMIMVDPNLHTLKMTGYDCSAHFMAKYLAEEGAVVVSCEFKTKLVGWKALTNISPTCVTAVKIATGFYSSAITPYGLFKDLLRNGGEVVTP